MADPAPSPGTVLVSQASLESWGRGVGAAAAEGSLRLPLVLALRGPLGAGKSVLARAIARGAGVSSPMPSPTYNLLFTYSVAGLVVHHLDLYRLSDPDDVWELGWEELGQGEELVLIEWPERAEALLPEERWEVRLDRVDHDDDDGAGDHDGADAAAGADPLAGLRTLRVAPVGGAPEPPPVPPGEAGEAGKAGEAGEAGEAVRGQGS